VPKPFNRVSPLVAGLLVIGLGTPVAAGVIVSADADRASTAMALEDAQPASHVRKDGRRLDPTGLDRPRVTLAEMRAEAEAERLARIEARREAARRAAELKAQRIAERAAAREARREARQQARQEAAPVESGSGAPMSFRVGSFNVLGSQHTAPGGDRQGFPPASTRTPAAARLAARHGVDILGTQELQTDQLAGLTGATGMTAWPGTAWGSAETDNSILYDPGVFEYVSGERFTLTFMGRPRPQPILRLRHRATGRELYVVNTHPSAGDGAYAAQRRAGQSTLVSVVNNLKSQGLPVLVTGDMNDREAFFCAVLPPTGMRAPNGGSYGTGCSPPPSPVPVDWVVGFGTTWSEYWRDTSPVTQRTSDHFFISARAHIG
jgi:hypothetical protein